MDAHPAPGYGDDMSKSQLGFMKLSSGIEISYREWGNPKGLPILMLHGFTDSWRSFQPLAEQLPQSIRTIALSQRGHGDSAKPADGYTVAQFAQDAADALDYLEINRAIVLGHCMGSLVAQRLAAHWPKKVSALVLIGAMRSVKGNPAVEDLWREGVAAMVDPIDPAFVQAFQQSTLARPVPQAFFEQVIGESRKVPARVWRSTLRSLLDVDGKDALGRIAAPSYIIWGDQDGLTLRAEQQALVSALPSATLAVHEGAGHSPHWEDPARVADEVGDWTMHLTAAAA
jgi:pimeloyl-ACP methyl ester carboxylesterase